MSPFRKETVQKFQSVVLDEFGVTMTYVEAERRLLEVVDLFELLYSDEDLNSAAL